MDFIAQPKTQAESSSTIKYSHLEQDGGARDTNCVHAHQLHQHYCTLHPKVLKVSTLHTWSLTHHVLCLKVCLLQKHHRLKPNPQGDGIRRLRGDEVLRVDSDRGSHSTILEP